MSDRAQFGNGPCFGCKVTCDDEDGEGVEVVGKEAGLSAERPNNGWL